MLLAVQGARGMLLSIPEDDTCLLRPTGRGHINGAVGREIRETGLERRIAIEQI